MSINFNNLEQVKQEFGIQENEPAEIRKKLRVLQAELHPDKYSASGEFESQEKKERYMRVEAAIKFLENNGKEQTALIPVNEVTNLIKAVTSLIPANQAITAETNLSTQVSQNLANIRVQYIAPKVIVSAIPAVITAIWIFPTTVLEHPVLKMYIDIGSPQFLMVWLGSLMFSAFFWLFFQRIEYRQRQFQLLLKTESFQNSLFQDFLQVADEEHFTKDEFINFITNRRDGRKRRYRSLISVMIDEFFKIAPDYIDVELAQNLADIIFERAEKRNVIEKDLSAQSLSEYYARKKNMREQQETG